MKMRFLICVSVIITGLISFASDANAAAQVRSNEIRGFEFTSCQKSECIILKAPKAYMGIRLDLFSTSGPTIFEITDLNGKLRKQYSGTSATLNPQLQTIVFENNDSYLLYSLVDGKITDSSGGLK